MRIIHYCTGIFLLLLVSLCGRGQTRVTDSLLQRVYSAKGQEQQLKAILDLCDEYKSMARDTLDYYSFLAREIAGRTTNKRLKDLAELAVAYDYMRWGWTDSVLFTVAPVIQENDVADPGSRAVYFKASRLKAMSYAMHSRYREALTVLYRIVKEAETYKDTLTLAENTNSIGSIALARNKPREALTWLSGALALTTDAPMHQSIRAAIFVNTAEAYSLLKKTDSADSNIEKGIRIFKETENLYNLAIALQKRSAIFLASGKLEAAESTLKELIALRQQSGDSAVYVDDNLSLIDFYIQTDQLGKAIQYCKNALVTGDLHMSNDGNTKNFTNNINIRLEYYKALAKCYKLNGDDSSYQHMLEQIITAKDSFYHYNSAQAIAELQTNYEVQKKENTIIQQKLDITRKNNRFYAFLGMAVFIAIISGLLFYGYRKKEKYKLNAILEREKLIAAQSVTKAEENERKRIAADLHDNLGAYAASIVSNLDFLSLGQERMQNNKVLHELRNNSQAIVSQLNDTIWALKKEDLSLTAISDRIKIFIQRIQPSYPHIAINVIEAIEKDLALTPSQAFHLFRIMQEAITNSLKHGRAKEISILLESDDTVSGIRISDDGTGIKDTDAMKKEGNGLLNMQKRAKEAGWTIEWHAGLPHGTSVILSPAAK
ncbi:MAG: histidine kinase [Candidatus Pseudobacter hemicellulosilyticus]|uniref:histidine kinase n=1 Tax=Candidatus Pseudobacter hemicellulosilyticus TaxID=3121375 RepID=A0AAJ5WR36_9BACT|nr:MAG: histidine kinase [Pseudobacter sp.]